MTNYANDSSACKCTCALVLYLLILIYVSHASRGGAMKTYLDNVANDGLGIKKMQAEFDQLKYRNQPVNGPFLVEEISLSLKTKLAQRIEALKDLKNVYEKEYPNLKSTSPMSECCHTTGLEYESNFNTKVNRNTMCTAISSSAIPRRKLPNYAILDVIKANVQRDPLLKWQYIATEEGVLYNYPAFKRQSCSDYDPRFRPFYVFTATPTPKDVVVVIDKSGSMSSYYRGRSYMEIAKEAATTVLNTLNPDDRVGIVAFSDTGYTPPSGCYANSLAKATPRNIKHLISFISEIRANGGTQYANALKKAFDFFNGSETTDTERDQVILFFTDGQPNDKNKDNILTVIRDRNLMLKNKLVLMTFGVGGAGISNKILQHMARQTTSDRTIYDVKETTYQFIADANKLRDAMASYYNTFSKPQDTSLEKPIFLSPYIDLFSLGRLIGVACVDVTIEELFEDVTYFRQGELSYAFISDGSGRTLVHPLIPRPLDKGSDPVFVDISALERGPGVETVLESMKAGETGTETLISTRTVSRGDVRLDGVSVTSGIKSHYYWTTIGHGNFSLCIVVADSDKQAMLERQPVPSSSQFTYHRLDLKPSQHICRHYRRIARKDASTVFLSASAFKDPAKHLAINETKSDVDAYEVYFSTSSTLSQSKFKVGIKDTVLATEYVDGIWLGESAFAGYVVWKYLGMLDGVLRVYPGVQSDSKYDHTQRPWFKRTLAHKGQLVISPPYLDEWGSGYVMTLSKVIYEGEPNGIHKDSNPVIGVMATDFTIEYFYSALMKNFPDCEKSETSCFAIDTSGFIIMHDTFINPTTKVPRVENVHITELEKNIAIDLVRRGMMTRSACQDFENVTYRHYWTVHSLYKSFSGYEFHPVTGSNIFVIISKVKISFPTQNCHCTASKLGTQKCLSTLTTACECPCLSKARYKYCQDIFDLTSDTWPTCTPLVPHVNQVLTGTAAFSVARCFDQKCSAKTTMGDCHANAQCSWCLHNCDGTEVLRKPSCMNKDECYFGRKGGSGPYTRVIPDEKCETTSNKSEAKSNYQVTIGVTATVVLLVLIAASTLSVVMKRRQKGCFKPKVPPQTPLEQPTFQPERGLYPYIPPSTQASDPSTQQPPPAYNDIVDPRIVYNRYI